MESKKIGIVTVTYNSYGFLSDFISSVRDQSHKNYAVYCIDNASSDGTQNRLREMTDARWKTHFSDENLGFAEGSNRGIQAALDDACDWVLLLNNDTSFGPEFLSEMVDGCLSQGWKVVVPKIRFDTPPGHIWYGGGGFNPRRGYTGYHAGIGEIDKGQYDTAKTVRFSPACAMLVHRDVFQEVGLLDETYFVYFEDTDFCLRLGQANISIGYWPRAALVHKVGGSTGGGTSPFTARITARNRLYYLKKHFGTSSAHAWTPIFLAYYFVRYGFGQQNFASLKASLQGTFAYFSMTPRVPPLKSLLEQETSLET